MLSNVASSLGSDKQHGCPSTASLRLRLPQDLRVSGLRPDYHMHGLGWYPPELSESDDEVVGVKEEVEERPR